MGIIVSSPKSSTVLDRYSVYLVVLIPWFCLKIPMGDSVTFWSTLLRFLAVLLIIWFSFTYALIGMLVFVLANSRGVMRSTKKLGLAI